MGGCEMEAVDGIGSSFFFFFSSFLANGGKRLVLEGTMRSSWS